MFGIISRLVINAHLETLIRSCSTEADYNIYNNYTVFRPGLSEAFPENNHDYDTDKQQMERE